MRKQRWPVQQLSTISILLQLGIVFSLLPGCAMSRVGLLDMKVSHVDAKHEEAYKKISLILVDKGFDLRMADKDLGIITTEWRKFSTVDGWPPFDLYLQVRATVRPGPDDKLLVTLTPKVKEVNRLNASAFTERALFFYDAEEQREPLMPATRANIAGQMLFLDVAQRIADALNLRAEDFQKNLQTVSIWGN